jgi:hypothetical protein
MGPERGVPPAVEKTSMYSKSSVLRSALDGHERPWTRSFLSVAKKLSATVLSKRTPLEPIDCTMPAARACFGDLTDPQC